MTGPCFICQRESARYLTYKKDRPVCMTCAPFSYQGEMMIDVTDTEMEALTKGGEDAGEFLDGIGKTDLAALSAEEWSEFLCRVLGGYSAHMQAEAKKYPPF